MARRAKHRLMNEINVVPYIDVMLVLLIIFMVTAPFMMLWPVWRRISHCGTCW